MINCREVPITPCRENEISQLPSDADEMLDGVRAKSCGDVGMTTGNLVPLSRNHDDRNVNIEHNCGMCSYSSSLPRDSLPRLPTSGVEQGSLQSTASGVIQQIMMLH